MKKMNFWKAVVSVASAMLLTSGVFGQVANGDYAEYGAAGETTEYVTLRTGGSTVVGYYALPDPVYHPNYDAGNGWALTANFTWAWTIPTMPAPGDASVTGGGTPANYVEITYTATGAYVLNVAETAPAAMGSCADASPSAMNVTVIAPPVATITTGDPAQACGDGLAMAVAMTFTEAVPQALAGYAFAITEVVDNIDASGGFVANVSTDNAFVDFPTTGKLEAPTLTNAASPYGYSFNTSALTVQNGLRTRYTYTAVKATDAPAAAANGVMSAISQKSDYVAEAGGADYLTYAFTDNSIVIIRNPAPSTGPIYYVPNTFNY